MLIIGCDYHPSFQQIAFWDMETGETGERRLAHPAEAEAFYAGLPTRPVRIGMEATGHARWFERRMAELGHELWIGDPAKIRAARVRRQKTDAGDAAHLLRLLTEARFPRLWVPTLHERDARQLLLHRHRLVQLRTKVKNQLQALALNEGMQRKSGLWSAKGQAEFRALPLLPWADRRRQDLLRLRAWLDEQIAPLETAITVEAKRRPEVVRLIEQQVGVGPIVGLAFVLTLGPVERFRCGKQVASYLGLIPSEYSSGGRQHLGHLSKQGNSFMRWLLVEAAQSAARHDAAWRRQYARLAVRKSRSLAKVALARKLAVRLYWSLRRAEATETAQGSHAG
jgi:transposase